MDISESLLSKEHGGCSFDALLSKHRTALLSRVDSLRCSVEKFDERCRKHLNSRGLLRRRSDGDVTAWGWFAGRTADGIGTDCWATTSESDTDESVVEVCAATRKLRQTRGTQTNMTRCSCQRNTLNHRPSFFDIASVRDAATQTLEYGHALNSADQIEEKVVSKQLLDVLEALAMQRPKNGRHRSLARKTTPGSPIVRRTKDGKTCISELLSRLQHEPSCLEDSIHRLLKADGQKICTRTENTNESEIACRSTKHFKRRKLYPNGTEVKEDECGYQGLGAHHVDAANVEEEYGLEDTSFHTDDDLWRLAEEGRLPWTCDLLKTPSLKETDDDDNAPTTARLFYSCEVDSSFGPLWIFRRGKRCLPPWRWISVPPNLGVIPEHSDKHTLKTTLTNY